MPPSSKGPWRIALGNFWCNPNERHFIWDVTESTGLMSLTEKKVVTNG